MRKAGLLGIVDVGIYSQQKADCNSLLLNGASPHAEVKQWLVSNQTFGGTPNIQLHFSWSPALIFVMWFLTCL